MDEAKYEDGAQEARRDLETMLEAARDVARVMDPLELRVEQRITIEAGGPHDHAKWNRVTSAAIFDDDDLDEEGRLPHEQ